MGELKLLDGSVYHGQWDKEGHLCGYGVKTNTDLSVYKGNFQKDLYYGQGSLTYPNGSSYTGTFVLGQMEGTGTYECPDYTYTG